MREAKPAFALSFVNAAKRAVDSREKRVTAKSFAVKAKKDAAFPRPSSPPSAGSRRRMGTIAVRDLATSPRRSSVRSGAGIDLRDNSSTTLTPAALPTASVNSTAAAMAFRRRSSNSSFLALNGGLAPEADPSAAGVLVSDLEHENEDVKQQLESTKARLAGELQQQEQQRLGQQQQYEREAREAREALEQITKARDDMVAVNRVLLSQQRLASKSHRLALERERQDAEAARNELEQARSDAQTLQQQIEELQHEKAATTRRWQELQDEHRDAARQVEELHERLIEAQREASDARSRADDDIDCLSDEEDDDDSASELSRVLRFERRRSMSDVTASEGGSGRRPSRETTASRQSWQRRNSSPSLAANAVDMDEELSKQQHECQRLREQVTELEFGNTTSRRLLSALQEELREANEREHAARTEYAAQLDALEKAAQLKESENSELKRALQHLQAEQRAREDAKARDGEFLAQFKQQLARGITLTKYGARGAPHARVVYADAACRWLSWRAPAANLSLTHPRPDARVDTSDLVGVVAGATTDVFLRQAVENEAAASASASSAATTCLSLVMLNPCRTLDLQADSVDQSRFYLRGFRLLCEEAAAKRQRLLLGAAAAPDASEPSTSTSTDPGRQHGGRQERAPSAAEPQQQQPNYF